MHDTIGGAVKLHKDVIPDLDEAIAIFIGRAWWATWNISAVIIENLTAGAAWTRITHGPEVI